MNISRVLGGHVRSWGTPVRSKGCQEDLCGVWEGLCWVLKTFMGWSWGSVVMLGTRSSKMNLFQIRGLGETGVITGGSLWDLGVPCKSSWWSMVMLAFKVNHLPGTFGIPTGPWGVPYVSGRGSSWRPMSSWTVMMTRGVTLVPPRMSDPRREHPKSL